jgi:uncharacterized protein (DUF1330 family)
MHKSPTPITGDYFMMLRRKLMAGLILSTLSAAVLVPTATQAQAADPVYLIASLKVSDFNAYMKDYGQPVMPMLLNAGGKVLVGAPSVEVLEGKYGANWTVVVQFPSEAAAKSWYESAEYKKFIAVRQGLTDQSTSIMLLAPEFKMPNG